MTAVWTRRPSARPSTCFITAPMTRPMSFGLSAPVSATAWVDDRLELVVGELGRQVAGDQLGLGLLAGGELVAAGVAELAGGVEAALALAAQDGLGVAGALLLVLLELGEHEAQSRHALLLPRPHGGGEIGLDLVENGGQSTVQSTALMRRQGRVAATAGGLALRRRPARRLLDQARPSSPSSGGWPSWPRSEVSRPKTSSTFQSMSRRNLRFVPGISSRW